MSKKQQELIDHIEDSILKAEANESKLPRSVLHDIHGMSTHKTRAFMNNLVNIPGGRYLEIGSWKGSTLISACITEKTIVIIDDWEFRNGEMVQPGTRQGIKEAGFEVAHERIIHTGDSWWFGFAIFLLK